VLFSKRWLPPAPLKRRDLDPDLSTYLEDCSADIPLKHRVELQFVTPKEIRNNEIESKVTTGLKTYFHFLIRSIQQEISQAYKRCFIYILNSFILLSLAFYFTSIIPEDSLFAILVEGLYIGGWVFLWEAIALFVFKNRDINLQCKKYKRLETAPTTFIYH